MPVGKASAALTLTTAAFFCGGAEVAHAQVPDMFARNRNVAVQARPRPDYEALGLRAGAFFLFPKVEFAADYNSNIYATASDEVETSVLHIRPELVAESNWSQHFATAFIRGALNRVPDYSSEDTDEYSLGASGRLDITRTTNAAAGIDFASTFEPRSAPNSPSAAVEPVAVSTTSAYLAGSRAAGRLKLAGRISTRVFDYEDGRNGLGAVIDQDFRDRDVLTASGRVDVAISPDTALFLQVTGNERTYDLAGTPTEPTRDSSGVEYLGGASFEVGSLARGEISAGYISQQFDAPAFEDASGFSARAALEWFPSELTTVSVSAGRSVEDAVNPGASSYIASSGAVTVDHELLRNVILSGTLSYSHEDYQGVDRADERVGATLGATYLINRYFGINVGASTNRVTSEGSARDDDFTVNRLFVSLVSQF